MWLKIWRSAQNYVGSTYENIFHDFIFIMKRTLHNRRVSLLLVTVRTKVRMNVYAEIPYPEGLKNVLMEGKKGRTNVSRSRGR